MTAMNHHLMQLGLEVPDLKASTDHAVEVLGLELRAGTDERSELALPGQSPCLVLYSAARSAYHHALFHTSAENLDEVRRRAVEAGIEVLAPHFSDKGLRLHAPNGVAIELSVGEGHSRNTSTRNDGVTIGSLDHLSFTAEDVPAFTQFFIDILGFRLSDSVNAERHWMRCGPNHHTIAVVTGSNGMHHYAFETSDIIGLANLGDTLAKRELNFLWGPGRHSLGQNIFTYHLDPAGSILEVCSNMVQIDDEEEWEYRVWTDGLKSAVMWGPTPPAGFRDILTGVSDSEA